MINLVNFNDETTMTRPRRDVVNFMILQQLQDLLDIYGKWEIEQEKGTDKVTVELKSQILKMIMLIKTPLDVRMKKDKDSIYIDVNHLREILMSAKSNEIIKIIEYIEQFLYEKDVTKWDTKEAVDRKDIWRTKQRYLG